MPPPAIARSVLSAISGAPRASSSSITDACGKRGPPGVPPKPPWRASKVSCSLATAASSSPSRIGSADGASCAPRASCSRTRSPPGADLGAVLRPRFGDRLEHLRPRRHTAALAPIGRAGREVGAAVEGQQLGRQEHVQRPAAVAGHALHGLHVDGVDVGALLAVDLHAHEALVHQRARCAGPRRTPAPSRGTNGRRSSRSRPAAACRARARARTRALPTAASRRGSRRAGAGTGELSAASALAISGMRASSGQPQLTRDR